MTTVFADEYGYNTGDATSALQAAIDDPNASRIVVRDVGSPWLISQQIELKSNKEIVFEAGSVVQAKPGSFLANDRAMFYGLNIQNIKLVGEGSGDNKATLKMNKEEYNSSEFGHVVSLLGVDGFEVSGLKLTGGGGDGLHIAGGAFERPEPNVLYYSNNGLVENITSDNNRRSGMSIDAARNLVVRNSSFTNTSGTKPSAGINLEPTWDFESLQNVRLENIDVSGNTGKGLQVTLGNLDNSSPPISLDFDNVNISDNLDSAIFVVAGYIAEGSDFGSEFKGTIDENSPQAQVNGNINFSNINISNPGTIAAGNNAETYIFIEDISGSQADPNNLKVNFNNININDPVDTPVSSTPIYIQGLPGDTKPQEIGNVSFNDVSITGNYDVDVVRSDLGRDDASLSNVSGDVTVFNANPRGARAFFDGSANATNLDLNVVAGDGAAPTVNQASAIAPESEPVEDIEAVVAEESEAEVLDPEIATVEESETDVIEDLELAVEPEVAAVEAVEPVVSEDLEAVIEEPEAIVAEDLELAVEPEAVVAEDLEAALAEEVEAEVLDPEIATVEASEADVVEEPEAEVPDTEIATVETSEAVAVEDLELVVEPEIAAVDAVEPVVAEDLEAVAVEEPEVIVVEDLEAVAVEEVEAEVLDPEIVTVETSEADVIEEPEAEVVEPELTVVEPIGTIANLEGGEGGNAPVEEAEAEVPDTEIATVETSEAVAVEDLELVVEPEIAAVDAVEPVVAEDLEAVIEEPEAEAIEPELTVVEPIETIANLEGGEGGGVPVEEVEAEVLDAEIATVAPLESVVIEEPEAEVVEPELTVVEPVEAIANPEGGEGGGVPVADPSIAFAEPEVEAVEVSDPNVATVESSEMLDEVESIEIVTAEPPEFVADGAEISASLAEPEVETLPTQNSDFSDSLSGWNSTGGNISVVERALGDRWARIDAAIGGISQDVSGLIEPGSDYQVSATTQLADFQTRGYVGVRFTTAADELIDLKYASVGSDTITEDRLDFTAPDNFAKAELFAFKNNGAGSLFVDDLSLSQGE